MLKEGFHSCLSQWSIIGKNLILLYLEIVFSIYAIVINTVRLRISDILIHFEIWIKNHAGKGVREFLCYIYTFIEAEMEWCLWEIFKRDINFYDRNLHFIDCNHKKLLGRVNVRLLLICYLKNVSYRKKEWNHNQGQAIIKSKCSSVKYKWFPMPQ